MKFIYLYHGGTMPDSPEGMEEMMGKWHAYFGALGDKLVDGGAPFGEADTVGGQATSGSNGYSIVDAGDAAAAKAMTDGHPHLAYDGSIEIRACMEM